MRRRTALIFAVAASLAAAIAADEATVSTVRAAVPGPDVGVAMTASPDPVTPQGTLTYTIDVTNHDTATPADVTLTVMLVDEPLLVVHEFIDGAPVPVVGGWFTSVPTPLCSPPAPTTTTIPLPDGPVVGGSDYIVVATPTTNTVTCTIAGLAPMTTSTITIAAEVARGLIAPAPLIVNTARVSSLGDPNPANDVAVTKTCVLVGTPPCVP